MPWIWHYSQDNNITFINKIMIKINKICFEFQQPTVECRFNTDRQMWKSKYKVDYNFIFLCNKKMNNLTVELFAGTTIEQIFVQIQEFPKDKMKLPLKRHG